MIPILWNRAKMGLSSWDYLAASTSGKAQKRFNRRGESGHFHISKMQTPEDSVEWHVQMKHTGNLSRRHHLCCQTGMGKRSLHLRDESGTDRGPRLKSTEGWYEYKTERIGQLDVKKTGRTLIKIYPKVSLDHFLMYFNKIELKPANKR